MLLSTRIYGAQAVKVTKERAEGAVLVIGADTFTRWELAKVTCFSWTAARNLTQLFEDIPVNNLTDVYQHYGPMELAIPRLGPLSLMVLGAAFEIKKLGTIETWATKHLNKGRDLVAFGTVKAQVKKAQDKTRQESRTKKKNGTGRKEQIA